MLTKNIRLNPNVIKIKLNTHMENSDTERGTKQRDTNFNVIANISNSNALIIRSH
jgi:hypothetical protein